MQLKDLEFKSIYDYEEDDLINDFYIPALRLSSKYDRKTGDFSSTSLSAAAKGFSSFFFKNGKMRLLSSVAVQEKDYDILINKKTIPPELEEKLLKSIQELEDVMAKDNLSILAWLLKENRLEIRIIFMKKPNTIFHEKAGILTDSEGNSLLFFGSLNESKTALDGNGERFLTFRNWGENREKQIVSAEKINFEKKWETKIRTKSITYELSEAVKRKILKYTERKSKNECEEDLNGRSEGEKNLNGKGEELTSFELRRYQDDAIQIWISNKYRSIISFATAGGKTITAIFGIFELYKREIKPFGKNLLVSIVVPTDVIEKQWVEELERYFEKKISVQDSQFKSQIRIMRTMGDSKWFRKLMRIIATLTEAKKSIQIIITSYQTYSKIFEKLCKDLPSGTESLLIADEVHRIGASSYKKGLIDDFQYRLGLSATPERKYDWDGYHEITAFFEHIIESCSYREALEVLEGGPYVSPYILHYIEIELLKEEKEKYNKITSNVIKLKAKAESIKNLQASREIKSRINDLYMKRADILKTSHAKYKHIDELIKNLKKDDSAKMLVFAYNTQDKNNNLYEDVEDLLRKNGIKYMPLISGSKNREDILDSIKKENIQVILTKEVLDEGLSVDNVNTAILISNKNVERQWNQRRGRIVRIDPYDKDKIAHIYDFFMTKDGKLIGSEKERFKFFEKDAKEVIKF